MSASGSSSDITKKLITLLLSLLVISILFTAIIFLWVNSNGSVSRPDNANTSVNTSMGKIHNGEWDNGLMNTTTVSGITRTSLVKSIALLYSAGDGAAWLDANPDWRLFMAQADYMDSKGLSKVWSLILKSANGSLVAYVDNGAAFVLSVEDNANNEGLPVSGQFVRDSNDLLNNVTSTKSISADADLTPFALVYNDDGGDGIYRLSYNNPADVSSSFVMRFNAKSGELFED